MLYDPSINTGFVPFFSGSQTSSVPRSDTWRYVDGGTSPVRCCLSPGTGRTRRFRLSSGIDRNVAVDFQFATYSASWHVCESLICEAIDGFLPYSTEKPTIDMISKRPQGGKAVMCIPYSEDIEPISTLSRPSH